MAKNRTICTQNNVDYASIRMAMCKDARTADELKETAGICGVCEGCTKELPQILSSVCGCKDVSMQTVIKAVENGADTVEKVMEKTGAGTAENCERCQKLIASIIQLGR